MISYEKLKPPVAKNKTVKLRASEGDSGQWYSEYGDENNKHIVFHNGIRLDQVLASCLFPYAERHTTMQDEVSGTIRTYWDGAFLSNTPLRELIQHHKDFWLHYFVANDIGYDDLGTESDDNTVDQNIKLTRRKKFRHLMYTLLTYILL